MPKKPYATNDFAQGMYRKAQSQALQSRHVQFNFSDSRSVLLFDVDREGAAFAWESSGLPPPSWVAINPENGHAHLAYVLERPVQRMRDAGCRPVKLLRWIEGTMTCLLNADPAYHGLVTKNPLHGDWKVIEHHKLYSLDDLCDYLDTESLLRQPRRRMPRGEKPDGFGQSRKITLFHEARQFAYSIWEQLVSEVKSLGYSPTLRSHAESANRGIGTKPPLPDRLVFKQCQSIERWCVDHYDQRDRSKTFSNRQRFKQGRQSANRRSATERKVRDAIAALRSSGKRVTCAAVARQVGCSRPNISQHYREILEA